MPINQELLDSLRNTERTIEDNNQLSAALEGADLQNMNLDGLIFTGLKLSKTNFTNSILNGANFQGVKLTNVIFMGAKLKRANFEEAELILCDFDSIDSNKTDLSEANFKRAVLISTTFYLTNLYLANFENSYLSDVHFNDSFLLFANFNGAEFAYPHGIDFDGAVTLGATFVDIINDRRDDRNQIYDLIENNYPEHFTEMKDVVETKRNNKRNMDKLYVIAERKLSPEQREIVRTHFPHIPTYDPTGGRRKNKKTKNTKRLRGKTRKRKTKKNGY